MPHTVLGTNAGAVSHRLQSSSHSAGRKSAEEGPARLFLCGRCRAQVIICRRCDRGQIYCGQRCTQEARRSAQRAANKRYQTSHPGRIKACRPRPPISRAAKECDVSGFTPAALQCFGVEGARDRARENKTLLSTIRGDQHGSATGAAVAARRLFVKYSCLVVGPLEPINVEEDVTVTISAELEPQILRYHPCRKMAGRHHRPAPASTL